MSKDQLKKSPFIPSHQQSSLDRLAPVEIADEEFKKIRQLVYNFFGINLTINKQSLIIGRLQKYLIENDFHTFKDYLSFLESDRTGDAINALINRISTNYTYFFRERKQFEFILDVVLPKIVTKPENKYVRDIRIWSAGCSTGDEPYSLMITLMEYLGDQYKKWDAGVLATDVCETALSDARKAVYPATRLRHIEPEFLTKYFYRKEDRLFYVHQWLKDEVIFRRFNLVNDAYPFKKEFDIICCRNVMIYFDTPTCARVIKQFYNLTKPGGYLFLGSSESMHKDIMPYAFVQPGIYRKEALDG